MPKNIRINEEIPIGIIIKAKGKAAQRIIDGILCDNQRSCYPGTTVKLGAAATLTRRYYLLPDLITKLNNLP